MFLFCEGFQPQNLFILFLRSMKHSCLLGNSKDFLLLTLIILSNWGYTTLEEYKIVFPNGTCDYITKDNLKRAQVILL